MYCYVVIRKPKAQLARGFYPPRPSGQAYPVLTAPPSRCYNLRFIAHSVVPGEHILMVEKYVPPTYFLVGSVGLGVVYHLAWLFFVIPPADGENTNL